MPPDASQPVDAPLSRSAIFITLTVNRGGDALDALRGLCADLPSLVKAVSFRSPPAGLSCIMGLGADLWQRLDMGATPAGLHPFRAIQGVHAAPSTPGDVLFHIRASSLDFCFELATRLMQRLGGAVSVQDETHGFKFFDNRDLLGFVDGTENPVGLDLDAAVFIGDEDPGFAGGSYVIVQKYLHDLAAWEAIPTEQQERIIGRHKLSDVEFPDKDKASYAHNVLTNIEDASGQALEILRDNMPFGSAARGEFGTYFIGYAREPGRIETMLDNMFLGDPPGNYDRLLDVSRAVTGCLFFIPDADMLDRIGAGQPAVDAETDAGGAADGAPTGRTDGSLGLGTLKQGN